MKLTWKLSVHSEEGFLLCTEISNIVLAKIVPTQVLFPIETERMLRVITAAPELLAALERLVARADGVPPSPRGYESDVADLRAAWNQARSAIAKARGETND